MSAVRKPKSSLVRKPVNRGTNRTRLITTAEGRTVEIGIPGRPDVYKPNKTDRDRVANLALLGIPQEQIAACLGADGVSVDTLVRHYKYELEHYANDLKAKITKGTYRYALEEDEGGRKGITPNLRFEAKKFILKTRAGWKENDMTVINANQVQIVKRVIGVDDEDV